MLESVAVSPDEMLPLFDEATRRRIDACLACLQHDLCLMRVWGEGVRLWDSINNSPSFDALASAVEEFYGGLRPVWQK